MTERVWTEAAASSVCTLDMSTAPCEWEAGGNEQRPFVVRQIVSPHLICGVRVKLKEGKDAASVPHRDSAKTRVW